MKNKIYSNYPMYGEMGGKQYLLNTDYRYALKCFEVIEDDSISDRERGLAVISILFKDVIPDEELEEASNIARIFLECGQPKNEHTKRVQDMDWNYDKGLIEASFMSDYKIDIANIEYMHFWQYFNLICGLTEQAALSRKRDARNLDPNDYSDPKTKAKIIKIKQENALPNKKKTRTKKEEEQVNKFYADLGIDESQEE